MAKDCSDAFEFLDALADGELPPDRARDVSAHAESCAACAAELADRRRLKAALSRLTLPAVPARRSRARWIAAAAAVLVAAAAVFLFPARVPEVVALSSELHDRYLEGRLSPRELGLKVAIPGADFVGRCDCPPALGNSVPFIAFRQGQTPITLLILEGDPALPQKDRQKSGLGHWGFRADRNSVVITTSRGLTQIWVSRLPEPELVRAVQDTRVLAVQGDTRVSLEEMS